MKKKSIIKGIVDILMLVLMLLEYVKGYTGQLVHEMIGIALFMLLLTHNILNIHFYKNLWKGKYNISRIVTTIVDFAFLLCMVMTIALGVPISQKVFKFLNWNGNMTTRKLHTILGYWDLVILSIHLGLHLDIILRKLNNKLEKRKVLQYSIWLLEIMMVVYGIKMMIDVEFIKYLIGEYSFGNLSGNMITSLFSNASILCSISIIVYFLKKQLHKKKMDC